VNINIFKTKEMEKNNGKEVDGAISLVIRLIHFHTSVV